MNSEDVKKLYRLTADYHTHTVYSKMGPYLHGKGRIIDNVRAASEAGLSELAITDHGPSDFYGLNLKRIPEMRADIEAAMKEFPDVKVYLGVEADIVNSQNGLDVDADAFRLFDFVNAGYHYVPKCNMAGNFASFHVPVSHKLKDRLIEENTARIVKALTSNNIKILTHPGDKAYIDEAAVAAACESTGTLVEINARHRHPNADDLRIYAAYDVSFVISSDAHKPEHVGRYAESLALAFEAGIGAERIVNVISAEKLTK